MSGKLVFDSGNSRSARESQNFGVQFFRVDLAFSSLSWGIFVDSDDSDVVTSD